MRIQFLFFCCFFFGSVGLLFGQQDHTKAVPSKKHNIFWNWSSIIDPIGSSLQFGYNYQYQPWMDLQIELGFLGDDLTTTRGLFQEYAGFRIRPQVKFLRKKSITKSTRWYTGLLLSYQQLFFKDNKNFRIDDSFNQFIPFGGKEQTYAWYLVGGIDATIYRRFTISTSIGLGEVFKEVNITEGELPQNARILNDCSWPCSTIRFPDELIKRAGILLDFKIGYKF